MSNETQEQSPPRSSGGPPKRKILVIDDSEIALSLVEEALARAGYDVKTVLFPTKNDPLTLTAATFQPNLILADVEMPLLRGSDFVRIAKASPALRHMKFYFYSSLPPAQLEDLVQGSSADGFIAKSDDLASVVERVREILGA